MNTPLAGDAAALKRLLDERWSCRGYTDEQVPRATIEQLLTIAGRTPSWCNTQPWHVTVTSGAATPRLAKALLASYSGAGTDFDFPATYDGVFLQRRRESGWQLYDAVGIEKGDREASGREMLKNFEFFGAPHVAILTTEADLGVYGAIDCGLYVETFLLAAQALGLGAIPQAALAARSPFLREWFGLPESRRVVCAISFGFADPEHATATYRTSRVSIAESATFVD